MVRIDVGGCLENGDRIRLAGQLVPYTHPVSLIYGTDVAAPPR
jgi:hypothetical protein